MRFATPVIVLLFACTHAPQAPQAAPERLPTVEEVATWTMDAERARVKATLVMEESDRFTKTVVNAVVSNGTPIWRVSATNLIAGGWDVEIDPRTGRLTSARRRPGR